MVRVGGNPTKPKKRKRANIGGTFIIFAEIGWGICNTHRWLGGLDTPDWGTHDVLNGCRLRNIHTNHHEMQKPQWASKLFSSIKQSQSFDKYLSKKPNWIALLKPLSLNKVSVMDLIRWKINLTKCRTRLRVKSCDSDRLIIGTSGNEISLGAPRTAVDRPLMMLWAFQHNLCWTRLMILSAINQSINQLIDQSNNHWLV